MAQISEPAPSSASQPVQSARHASIANREGRPTPSNGEAGWHASKGKRRVLRSPDLRWHREYSKEGIKSGRVLVIDYVRKGLMKKSRSPTFAPEIIKSLDQTLEGLRKVAAEEIKNVEGLRKLYSNPERSNDAILRVLHVQNAGWATRYLLRKFNIFNQNDLVGTDFGNWVRQKQTERRAGKPNLNGRTWQTQRDPWRGIARTSLGLDYLKQYVKMGQNSDSRTKDGRFMELDCYDAEETPDYGAYEVFGQRLSVYIQYQESLGELPTDPDIPNPYLSPNGTTRGPEHIYVPQLNTLDNGNTIIIFDHSQSLSINDTLIPARGDLESRWRRLPFYLPYDAKEIASDQDMAIELMKLILQDMFKTIADNWGSLLDCCYDHVSILENKIYEEPADESRAPELWANSSRWLRFEKLILIHTELIREMETNLHELILDEDNSDDWLEAAPVEFERLVNLIQEDLIKPTNNLADLMYKSVGIRDSRHSLQLSDSMWRLSWITFIFLPLTFIVGFFGMNVDTFTGDPSIKWYFIVAVPFMILVIILLYVLKSLVGRGLDPYARAKYEQLFYDLSVARPSLWTRAGPRRDVRPSSLVDRVKWNMIKYWSAPRRTTKITDDISEDQGLELWSRIKSYWIKRWTTQIKETQTEDRMASLLEEGPVDELDPVLSGLGQMTEMLALPVAGELEPRARTLLEVPRKPASEDDKPSRSRSSRSRSSRSRSRSSSSRNSGVMVEEHTPDWLQQMRQQWRQGVTSQQPDPDQPGPALSDPERIHSK